MSGWSPSKRVKVVDSFLAAVGGDASQHQSSSAIANNAAGEMLLETIRLTIKDLVRDLLGINSLPTFFRNFEEKLSSPDSVDADEALDSTTRSGASDRDRRIISAAGAVDGDATKKSSSSSSSLYAGIRAIALVPNLRRSVDGICIACVDRLFNLVGPEISMSSVQNERIANLHRELAHAKETLKSREELALTQRTELLRELTAAFEQEQATETRFDNLLEKCKMLAAHLGKAGVTELFRPIGVPMQKANPTLRIPVEPLHPQTGTPIVGARVKQLTEKLEQQWELLEEVDRVNREKKQLSRDTSHKIREANERLQREKDVALQAKQAEMVLQEEVTRLHAKLRQADLMLRAKEHDVELAVSREREVAASQGRDSKIQQLLARQQEQEAKMRRMQNFERALMEIADLESQMAQMTDRYTSQASDAGGVIRKLESELDKTKAALKEAHSNLASGGGGGGGAGSKDGGAGGAGKRSGSLRRSHSMLGTGERVTARLPPQRRLENEQQSVMLQQIQEQLKAERHANERVLMDKEKKIRERDVEILGLRDTVNKANAIQMALQGEIEALSQQKHREMMKAHNNQQQHSFSSGAGAGGSSSIASSGSRQQQRGRSNSRAQSSSAGDNNDDDSAVVGATAADDEDTTTDTTDTAKLLKHLESERSRLSQELEVSNTTVADLTRDNEAVKALLEMKTAAFEKRETELLGQVRKLLSQHEDDETNLHDAEAINKRFAEFQKEDAANRANRLALQATKRTAADNAEIQRLKKDNEFLQTKISMLESQLNQVAREASAKAQRKFRDFAQNVAPLDILRGAAASGGGGGGGGSASGLKNRSTTLAQRPILSQYKIIRSSGQKEQQQPEQLSPEEQEKKQRDMMLARRRSSGTFRRVLASSMSGKEKLGKDLYDEFGRRVKFEDDEGDDDGHDDDADKDDDRDRLVDEDGNAHIISSYDDEGEPLGIDGKRLIGEDGKVRRIIRPLLMEPSSTLVDDKDPSSSRFVVGGGSGRYSSHHQQQQQGQNRSAQLRMELGAKTRVDVNSRFGSGSGGASSGPVVIKDTNAEHLHGRQHQQPPAWIDMTELVLKAQKFLTPHLQDQQQSTIRHINAPASSGKDGVDAISTYRKHHQHAFSQHAGRCHDLRLGFDESGTQTDDVVIVEPSSAVSFVDMMRGFSVEQQQQTSSQSNASNYQISTPYNNSNNNSSAGAAGANSSSSSSPATTAEEEFVALVVRVSDCTWGGRERVISRPSSARQQTHHGRPSSAKGRHHQQQSSLISPSPSALVQAEIQHDAENIIQPIAPAPAASSSSSQHQQHSSLYHNQGCVVAKIQVPPLRFSTRTASATGSNNAHHQPKSIAELFSAAGSSSSPPEDEDESAVATSTRPASAMSTAVTESAPYGAVGKSAIVPHSFGTAQLTGGAVAQQLQDLLRKAVTQWSIENMRRAAASGSASSLSSSCVPTNRHGRHRPLSAGSGGSGSRNNNNNTSAPSLCQSSGGGAAIRPRTPLHIPSNPIVENIEVGAARQPYMRHPVPPDMPLRHAPNVPVAMQTNPDAPDRKYEVSDRNRVGMPTWFNSMTEP